MEWLAPITASASSSRPVLVLCRTAATSALVQRWVSRNGGAVAIEIVTPTELAARLGVSRETPGQAEEGVTVPPDHPWAAVERRPEAKARLTRHLEQIVVERIPNSALPQPVLPLLEAGWGRTRRASLMIAALKYLQTGGDNVVANRFAACFAIGFGDPDADLPRPPGPHRYYRELLDRLGAVRLAAPARDAVQRIAATSLRDPHAEARWVVERVSHWVDSGGDIDGALVLAANAPASRAIEDAMRTAGLPVALGSEAPLSGHALGALVRTVASWFSSGPDPIIDAQALEDVLASPLLGWNLRPETVGPARLSELRELAGTEMSDERLLRPSRAPLGRALGRCRLPRAHLSHWRQAVGCVPALPDSSPAIARHAVIVELALDALADAIEAGTSGLCQWLALLGPRTRSDPAAQLIVEQLDRLRFLPPAAAVARCLSRSAPPSFAMVGASIVEYEDYDGRDAGLTLLTGLTVEALTHRVVADPFFPSSVHRVWGMPAAADVLRHVHGQVLAVTRRSGSVEASQLTVGNDGLPVVPMPGLPLAVGPPRGGVFGLRLETADNRSSAALASDRSPIGVNLPIREHAEEEHAARMVEAEWYRAAAVDWGVDKSLSELVATGWPNIPDRVRPWLGEAGLAAMLDRDRPLSATGALQDVSRCLYRAFLSRQVRPFEPELFTDPLDRREMGIAIHSALEGTHGTRWRVGRDDLEQVAHDLHAEIADRLETRTRALVPPRPTAAQTLAHRGILERWRRHFKAWVHWRLELLDPEETERRAREYAERSVASTRAFREVLARFRWPNMRAQQQAAVWFRRAANRRLDPFGDEAFRNVGSDVRQTIVYAATDPGFEAQLERIRVSYDELLGFGMDLYGPVSTAATEWRFGFDEERGPLRVRLGGTEVPIRGSVDRVRMLGRPDHSIAEIVDYKSGKPKHRWELERAVALGLEPQLIVYGMALREALILGIGPDGRQRSADNTPIVVAYDFLRRLEGGRVELPFSETDRVVSGVVTNLGRLVQSAQSGHWPLLPHPDGCPHLNPGAAGCPYASACRMAASPVGSRESVEVESREVQP